MWPAVTNGLALGWDSLQPEAPPERRRVASQAPALSPQQPPRERAGCERIIVVLVHAVPCDVRGAITGGLARIAHVIALTRTMHILRMCYGVAHE